MQMTGTDLLNVAYERGAPALTNLMAGQIGMLFEPSPTGEPYAKRG